MVAGIMRWWTELRETISIEAAGYTLHGFLFSPTRGRGPSPAVLMIHGWRGDWRELSNLAELLAGQGFFCQAIDLRGHGESPGDLNQLVASDFVEDVKVAYDYLASIEGVDSRRISVSGVSLGGCLAALLVAERPVASLNLRVPINVPDSLMGTPAMVAHSSEEEWSFLRSLQKPDASRALRAVHQFGGDILIIEGGKDVNLPRETVQSYVDAVRDRSRLTYILAGNAPHDFASDPEVLAEVDGISVEWFRRHAQSRR